jgi:hypothetical protein
MVKIHGKQWVGLKKLLIINLVKAQGNSICKQLNFIHEALDAAR